MRTVRLRKGKLFCPVKFNGNKPVSYTHLDVYKRQTLRYKHSIRAKDIAQHH